MNKIKNLSVFLFVLTFLFSQNNAGSIKTARLMEKQGDFDNAIIIYTDILNKDHNHQAYTSLKKILLQQKKLDPLVLLIKAYKERFPNKVEPYLDLGEVYWKLGKKNFAEIEWENAEKFFGNKSNTFKKLFYLFTNLGLSNKSQTIIDRGRDKFKDPTLLSIDIANYHFSRKSYKISIEEYLNYLSSHPYQKKMVTNKILLISDDKDSHALIERILSENIKLNSVLYGPIFADYYFKTQQYELAYSLHNKLGISTTKDIQRWLDFANSLRIELQYNKAVSAYEKILSTKNKYITETIAGEALLGLGITFEDKILPKNIEEFSFINYFNNNLFFKDPYYHQKDFSVQSLDTAFKLYDSLLTSNSSSSLSASAYFRLGEIQYKILNDFDGALNSYRKANRLEGQIKIKEKIQLRIGDIYIAEGDLNNAKNYFEKLSSKGEQFYYKYILSHFFSGNIDTTFTLLGNALNKIKPIDKNFNDLLEFRNFISKFHQNGNEIDKHAFQLFVLGEFYLSQKKLTEAIASYNFIQKQYPTSSIVNESILREAFIQLKINKISKSSELAEKLTNTKLAPMGLLLLGELYEKYEKDIAKALNYYYKLLEEHPDFYLSEPVRLHVRILNEQL